MSGGTHSALACGDISKSLDQNRSKADFSTSGPASSRSILSFERLSVLKCRKKTSDQLHVRRRDRLVIAICRRVHGSVLLVQLAYLGPEQAQRPFGAVLVYVPRSNRQVRVMRLLLAR